MAKPRTKAVKAVAQTVPVVTDEPFITTFKGDLTPERLRSVLSYEIETGLFTWRVTKGPSAPAGRTAGVRNNAGYQVVRIDRRLYLAQMHSFSQSGR